MASLTWSSSDDDDSLLPVQFSAATEALLASDEYLPSLPSTVSNPRSSDLNVLQKAQIEKPAQLTTQRSGSANTNASPAQTHAYDHFDAGEIQRSVPESSIRTNSPQLRPERLSHSPPVPATRDLPIRASHDVRNDLFTSYKVAPNSREQQTQSISHNETLTPGDLPYRESGAGKASYGGFKDEARRHAHRATDCPRWESLKEPSSCPPYGSTEDYVQDIHRPEQPSPHAASSSQQLRRVRLSPKRRTSQPLINPVSESFDTAPMIPAPATEPPAVVVPPTLKGATADINPPVSEKRKSVRRFLVNRHTYSVTTQLGRGGSGRVYEVVSDLKKVRAFKVIPLQNLDAQSKMQIQNEVALLQSLTKADRVISLHDWDINEARNSLYLVMELGQCDLDNILKVQWERNQKLDLLFVGVYWREVLSCIASIHERDIVHSDIKPANFILARGVLKIADFGIASALPDDTVNIYQEHQAGTPNYMAPETLKALSQPGDQALRNRAFRFGKPSDMWSAGCILYLMIYGRPPFGHVQGLGPKTLAIIDPHTAIDFPQTGLGGGMVPSAYVRTMEACLSRDPTRRPTAGSLLDRTDSLLRGYGMRDDTLHVTNDQMETLISDALREAGVQTSPKEVEEWTATVMKSLTRGS